VEPQADQEAVVQVMAQAVQLTPEVVVAEQVAILHQVQADLV
jgi:hypothetical protein